MSTGTIEVARDEGGDDRRREVVAARLSAILEQTYPELDEQALEDLLRDGAQEHATQPRDDRDDDQPKKASPTAPEGARAIYGHAPRPGRYLGDIATAAVLQSNGFWPAGVPGDQTARFLGFQGRQRRGRGPMINGVYPSW